MIYELSSNQTERVEERADRASEREPRWDVPPIEMALGEAWQDTELVFTREDGNAIHPQSLSGAFGRRVKRLGLPKIRFHDLRHTCASLLLQAGVPGKVVQEMLGHASIQITLDIYSHVAEGMQDDAAAKLGALVFRQ